MYWRYSLEPSTLSKLFEACTQPGLNPLGFFLQGTSRWTSSSQSLRVQTVQDLLQGCPKGWYPFLASSDFHHICSSTEMGSRVFCRRGNMHIHRHICLYIRNTVDVAHSCCTYKTEYKAVFWSKHTPLYGISFQSKCSLSTLRGLSRKQIQSKSCKSSLIVWDLLWWRLNLGTFGAWKRPLYCHRQWCEPQGQYCCL